MRKMLLTVGVLLGAILMVGRFGGSAPRRGVVVFAAASTVDALKELAARYEAETGTPVRINAASSGTLAKQLLAGAEGDLFLSANTKWMDAVSETNWPDLASRTILARNRLVWIVPAGCPFALDFRGRAPALDGRLAIGDPAHVPAGIAAKAALMQLGWWEKLTYAPTADVRAALRLVRLGEASAGIVYASDAGNESGVTVIAELPEGLHPPIVYPLVLCDGAPEEARAFYRLLLSASGREVFLHHGFRPPRGGGDGP